MVKPIIWLPIKRKNNYYTIDVAAIIIDEGYLPHFALIFNLSVEEAKKKDKKGILPFTFLLGKHRDSREWDFLEDNGKAMLLIPKRYVFLSTVFTYFVRLAPKKTANAAKA